MESLPKLWSGNITLKERQGQKETVKGVWQRAREGAHKLFEGQLARKCAKDWVLCWIPGPGITPKVLKVVQPFEHRETITDLEEMLQKL